ncbi:integral membrane protein [Colletotrichum incanum]|uniref:Integral membrane protein n=1 Tax=Colletotrichum incanum TaxID=1573173 RepID=A0A161Y6S8_COLIC|nr:integral membrane protein [Colletotrichum incanum]
MFAHAKIVVSRTCLGASWFKMLVMISNIVQELTNSKEPTQSVYTPADYDSDGDLYYMLDTSDDNLKKLSLAQTFRSFEDWLSTWTASGDDQDVSMASTSGKYDHRISGLAAQNRPLESLPTPYSLVDGQLRIVCTQTSPEYSYHKIYNNSSHQYWDWQTSRLINLQILNAVAFQSVNGIPAWTPVSLKDYQEKQLTLQVPISLQKDAPKTPPESVMPDLHGIDYLDRETSVQVRYECLMVLSPQCEIDMYNLAATPLTRRELSGYLLPCKHFFCLDCISNSTTCFRCAKGWIEKITLSGVMEHPSKGQAADNKPSKLLTSEQVCEKLEAIPHYRKSHSLSPSAENVAKGIASMKLGEQGVFWYNFIVSILKKAESQIRRFTAKALILSNAEAGYVHRVELLPSVVFLMDYTVQEMIAEKGLRELLRVSVDNVRLPKATDISGLEKLLLVLRPSLTGWQKKASNHST